METSVRARQLGGREARVGLVCYHYTPHSLRIVLRLEKSELEVAMRNPKIAIFGRVDLMNLGDDAPHRPEGDRILEWMKQHG